MKVKYKNSLNEQQILQLAKNKQLEIDENTLYSLVYNLSRLAYARGMKDAKRKSRNSNYDKEFETTVKDYTIKNKFKLD